MTSTLLIGNYTYSSWSLRGWLMFERFGLPVVTRSVDFSTASVAEQLAEHAPARTVPTWLTPEGIAVSDSLAIAEELASRHPEAGHWPADPGLRALARTLACEMHSGFAALRQDCPMNLCTAHADVPVSAAVEADLARLATIWRHALALSGGPWLCGAYTVADAFFAPVAARIAGYDLPIPEDLKAYVTAHLADPAFQAWRTHALAEGIHLTRYEKPWRVVDWPIPATA